MVKLCITWYVQNPVEDFHDKDKPADVAKKNPHSGFRPLSVANNGTRPIQASHLRLYGGNPRKGRIPVRQDPRTIKILSANSSEFLF